MNRTKGTNMKRKLVRATALGALAVALTLLLAACGGDGESGGVASLTNTTGETEGGTAGSGGGSGTTDEQERREAELEYAKCMREHGVDFPDPVNGRFEFRGTRAEQGKVDEAQEACRSILERVGPPELDEQQQAELREAALAFAKCMREHGVDMPDPTFRDDGGMLQTLPQGARDDPKFEDAQKACEGIIEGALPNGTRERDGDA
jgi:hypothetical protein